MIKISDITIDYRSLLERKDTIYYTDQSKPVLGFCVESDEQKIRVEKACISLNGWQEEIDEIAYVILWGRRTPADADIYDPCAGKNDRR